MPLTNDTGSARRTKEHAITLAETGSLSNDRKSSRGASSSPARHWWNPDWITCMRLKELHRHIAYLSSIDAAAMVQAPVDMDAGT